MNTCIWFEVSQRCQSSRAIFDIHMNADVPRSLLSTQYRMLSAIADTWNHLFYNGAVETSAERIAAGQGLHESDAVTFLDHRHFEKESQDSHSRGSKYNEGEASILMKILGTCIEEKGRTGKSQADTLKDIGIVSPYKSQVRFLQDAADKAFGVDHGLEIGTVETFQGREKDTMILSLVRSNGHIYSIGAALSFVTEPRRICVLLSRAKNRLFIVGNSDTLSRFANKWSEVISHCKLVSAKLSVLHCTKLSILHSSHAIPHRKAALFKQRTGSTGN